MAAAAWNASSMAVIACAVQDDSGPPQLMEITDGRLRVVVNRRGDRVEKTGVGVGSEIHRDGRLRRDCAHHFDIEHDLAIRSIRIAGGIVQRMIHGHGHDRRVMQGRDFGNMRPGPRDETRRPIR